MRLISVTVENFRCYAEGFQLHFNDLTALVGQNDVGKSALLDALSIFFELSSPDKDDACKGGNRNQMRISCEFDQLPEELIVDADFPSNLEDEFLLNKDTNLEIRKTYSGALVNPKLTSTVAIAQHPTASGYSDLLVLKRAELIERATNLGVNLEGIDRRKNAPIRASIWESAEDLVLQTSEIPLDKEGAKQIWTALQPYLPTFALFKSDRPSTDQDSEAQDPLKTAIREAVRAVEPKLEEVKEHVEQEVRKIAQATVEKLREMDPGIAETLNPVITTKKWESLFQTSITGDEGIPLNKRGSGVKRLVLLNFFRAKAEKQALDKKAASIIYAIEEPETSQHPKNQRLLLSALRELSGDPDRQVIITTHTPMLARYVPDADLRFIQRDELGNRTITLGSEDTSQQIAASLGVLPDNNVRAFVGVEGPHDINFLKVVSNVLRHGGRNVPDLDFAEANGEIIFFPFGGSNLALWASRLRYLNRPEYHICDRDSKPPVAPKYADHINEVNGRADCRAVCTTKRELENYLHPEAVGEAYQLYGLEISLPQRFEPFDDVPTLVAQAVHDIHGEGEWGDLPDSKKEKKEKKAKSILNGPSVEKMTVARLAETDPHGELEGWLKEIGQMMQSVGT